MLHQARFLHFAVVVKLQCWISQAICLVDAPCSAAADVKCPGAALVQTAAAGANWLKVKDAVQGWEKGQQVVITTTIWKDEQVGGVFAVCVMLMQKSQCKLARRWGLTRWLHCEHDAWAPFSRHSALVPQLRSLLHDRLAGAAGQPKRGGDD